MMLFVVPTLATRNGIQARAVESLEAAREKSRSCPSSPRRTRPPGRGSLSAEASRAFTLGFARLDFETALEPRARGDVLLRLELEHRAQGGPSLYVR